MSFAKNTGYPIPFSLINVSSGAALTGATVTARRVRDGGSQESCSGSVVEKGNGQYLLQGQANDFNADYTVGLLFTATGAVPAHVLVQMQRFRKNTAYSIPFLLVNSSNGSAKTGASVTGKRCLDGAAQEAVGGSFVERGNGQYVYQGVAADFNADDTVGFLFTASGAVPVHLTVDMEPELPGSGNTLKAKIYDVLAADAQINDPNHLGGMLGQYSEAPYGVYFRNPPDGTDFDSCSLITYFIGSMSGRFPRDIYINITAWGSNYEDILGRVYDLLHKKTLSTSDYQLLMLKWDNAMAESYADDYKTYYQQHRFIARAIKK